MGYTNAIGIEGLIELYRVDIAYNGFMAMRRKAFSSDKTETKNTYLFDKTERNNLYLSAKTERKDEIFDKKQGKSTKLEKAYRERHIHQSLESVTVLQCYS